MPELTDAEIAAVIAKYEEPVAPKCCCICGGPMREFFNERGCDAAYESSGKESAKHYLDSVIKISRGNSDPAVVALARELQQIREAFAQLCGARFRIGDNFIDLEWNDIDGKKVWKAFMGEAGEFPAPWRSEPFDTAWEAYQAAVGVCGGPGWKLRRRR